MDYDDEAPRRLFRWPVIRRSGVVAIIICAVAIGSVFILAGASGPFIIHGGGAGPDHPVHPYLPESAYLKSLLLQLD